MKWWPVSACLLAFVAGQRVESWWNGNASVWHFVDEGTAMNHGQPSVEVNFRGRLYGSDWVVNPHWQREETGDRIYFDSFSMEEARR